MSSLLGLFARSVAKEGIPPLLPVVWGGLRTGGMSSSLLFLLIGTNYDYEMLSWTNIAQFLTSLAFNDEGICEVTGLAGQAIVIGLQLLRLLLCFLDALHQ